MPQLIGAGVSMKRIHQARRSRSVACGGARSRAAGYTRESRRAPSTEHGQGLRLQTARRDEATLPPAAQSRAAITLAHSFPLRARRRRLPCQDLGGNPKGNRRRPGCGFKSPFRTSPLRAGRRTATAELARLIRHGVKEDRTECVRFILRTSSSGSRKKRISSPVISSLANLPSRRASQRIDDIGVLVMCSTLARMRRRHRRAADRSRTARSRRQARADGAYGQLNSPRDAPSATAEMIAGRSRAPVDLSRLR